MESFLTPYAGFTFGEHMTYTSCVFLVVLGLKSYTLLSGWWWCLLNEAISTPSPRCASFAGGRTDPQPPEGRCG